MVRIVKDKYCCSCISCGKRSDNPENFSCIEFTRNGNKNSTITGGVCKSCRKELVLRLLMDLDFPLNEE